MGEWKFYVRDGNASDSAGIQRLGISRIYESGTEIVSLSDGVNDPSYTGATISDVASAQKWLDKHGWTGKAVEVVMKGEQNG